IAFQLHVTGNSSWIDHIERLTAAEPSGGSPAASEQRSAVPEVERTRAGRAPSSLRNYRFTNQLGDPVSLADFRGQALALTFFFTRCPIPQYCPRLSRNFEEVQLKMHEIANAPTNWHLVSVTFDPAHDTPEVLKAYAESYHYDAAHWSFLTGPPDSITELVQACGVTSRADAGLFKHNFRTLIIDASNHLQMVFPTSGDLSDSIVQELLKGAGTTNLGTHTVASRAPSGTNP
ncbi:MAG TPA: SCO family protein, partial [Verrucomicrobiae bacterium]|nr:SCO family protein [Verrucomicrobiae bacterium]